MPFPITADKEIKTRLKHQSNDIIWGVKSLLQRHFKADVLDKLPLSIWSAKCIKNYKKWDTFKFAQIRLKSNKKHFKQNKDRLYIGAKQLTKIRRERERDRQTEKRTNRQSEKWLTIRQSSGSYLGFFNGLMCPIPPIKSQHFLQQIMPFVENLTSKVGKSMIFLKACLR